jgi:integrase
MSSKTDKPKEHLTAKSVRDVVPPPKGAATFWDNDPKAVGFGVRIYSTGTKSFFINYRIDGREKRHTIGAFPRWSVSAAREEAIELRKRIDKGDDPAGAKRERREAPTIADLIECYVVDHLPSKNGKKIRVDEEKRILALIGDALGRHTKVADLHGGDIKAMHRKITETRGPVRANRVLACASKMFSLSLVPLANETLPWRNAVLGNPCKGIARNREEGRERFFGRGELERIAEALAEYSPKTYPRNPAADCIRLVMLSGCRPAEAINAEWSEFATPGFWIKPSSHTKQQKTHRLPLNPPAVELIERLRKKRSPSIKFVFPGRKPSEPVRTLSYCWNFVRKRAQLGPDEKGRPARIYDLRHSFASVAVGGNLGLPIIGKLLGHAKQSTTQRYAHLADDPLREATNRIGAVIAGTGDKAGDVVPIRGGGAS